MPNPFRYDRLPAEKAFVDREAEVARIVACIREGENLLVQGDRRIGKTSCLLRAARAAADEFDAVTFAADLSRYATLADVTEALLRDAVPALSSLGEKASRFIAAGVKGLILKPTVKASLDAREAGGGEMEVLFGLELRAKDRAAHAEALAGVLTQLDTLAARRHRKVAVMLDEFTFLEKIGPERASWQLRSVMQHHQRLTYILAGSAHHLIEQMHGPDGAFYGMFGRLAIGPIPEADMVQWIDGQFREQGIKGAGVGEACVKLAGERTRDIVQLARRTFDLAAGDRRASARTVEAAFASLLDDFDSTYAMAWHELSPLSQAILTAVAMGHGRSLFSEVVRAQFSLGSTAEVSQVCRRLTRTSRQQQDFRDAILVRDQTAAGLEHRFDNPFFRSWVERLRQPRPT